MSVGFGGTLDGDGGSCKFALEIMLIQQVKNLVQITCYTVAGNVTKIIKKALCFKP